MAKRAVSLAPRRPGPVRVRFLKDDDSPPLVAAPIFGSRPAALAGIAAVRSPRLLLLPQDHHHYDCYALLHALPQTTYDDYSYSCSCSCSYSYSYSYY
jgi:hypothetical protein